MTTIKIDKRFATKLQTRFGKYRLEVGILKDRPHKQPLDEMGKGLTSYAGGPIRKRSSVNGPLSVAQVSKANRERLGFNYLSRPFKDKSSDIVRFSTQFFRLAFGRSEPKRAENLLQAIVRNPILRGDYGGNTPLTALIKGFNRGMIDTAQLFRSIQARIIKRV